MSYTTKYVDSIQHLAQYMHRVPSFAMSLLICIPSPITNMNTHLHRYRKTVSNQTSFITGLKITSDKIIVADEYLNTHEQSWNFQNTTQGSKPRPTWSNVQTHVGSNQQLHTYIYTYTYAPHPLYIACYSIQAAQAAQNNDSAMIFENMLHSPYPNYIALL